MFFTSGLIIAFFCFAFYLIWNQFLKKDARLSTGLQVLRKKIGDLENLSLSVESQVDHSLSLVQEKTQKLESLLQTAKQLCDRIEKNIKVIETLKDSDLEELAVKANYKKLSTELRDPSLSETKLTNPKEATSPFQLKEPLPPLKRSSSPSSHLKMVTKSSSQNPPKKRLEFGESPFKNIEFIDSPT